MRPRTSRRNRLPSGESVALAIAPVPGPRFQRQMPVPASRDHAAGRPLAASEPSIRKPRSAPATLTRTSAGRSPARSAASGTSTRST